MLRYSFVTRNRQSVHLWKRNKVLSYSQDFPASCSLMYTDTLKGVNYCFYTIIHRKAYPGYSLHRFLQCVKQASPDNSPVQNPHPYTLAAEALP